MSFFRIAICGGLILGSLSQIHADRYSYLDEPNDPYYVGTDFPKLITPQWVGEAGVDAVVVLSIDDMRASQRYEDFLRPILDRLKKIDGRAPVSIFTNQIDPQDPRLQQWLKEGLSLEIHTIDHPCPLLKDGDFAKAKSTYDRCVDLLNEIPNNIPVAFRMPCCDSLNTPSPRFYAEIFNNKTPRGKFLSIDSSVFNVFTNADKQLPKALVTAENGKSRFRHYIPFPAFVNTIENYPYPYVIGARCWEFPCVVPSDWEGQNVQQPNNPKTVADLKHALDATVLKQGVMPIVFHPHAWIRSDQMVDFVNYAQDKYGKRVKFLNFKECLDRVNQHLLDGKPLREPDGTPGLARIVDINHDGFMDVIRPGNAAEAVTKIWQTQSGSWSISKSQIDLRHAKFGCISGDAHLLTINHEESLQSFVWSKGKWAEVPFLVDRESFAQPWKRLLRRPLQIDDFRLRDLNGDGTSELLLTEKAETVIASKKPEIGMSLLPFGLPKTALLLNSDGTDGGLRFHDINKDGFADIVFSDSRHFGVWLFNSIESGWNQTVIAGQADDGSPIPQIVRADGTNNGAWFHSDHLWVQNEHTHRLPDLVDRISFDEIFKNQPVDPDAPFGKAKSPAEALQSFKITGGSRVELVASEPDIVDPVAFDWGPDGKIWVVEMRDYPNGVTWHGPGDPRNVPGGRVKLLQDTDGDGKHDEVHMFLDDLPFPTGIKAWRKGVLITAAPDILYAEDIDGDGKADIKKVLYRGLGEGNQQHRANGLRWGLDHWLHVANGDSGGKVKSLKTGKEIDIRGRDFKIKPDEGGIEKTSGQTQFGRCRDDFGNWFGGNNSNPVWQYVLQEDYQNRNPFVPPRSPRSNVSQTPGAAPVFPASRTVERFNDFDRANRYTSACSPEVFRDHTLLDSDSDSDSDFRPYIYVCEPVHNLVSREAAEYSRLTVSSQRLPTELDSEFLASSDNWFRPVMCRTGPDGALWVADLYRMIIEHPEWIPREWQDKIDHLAGSDRGRLYRVVIMQSVVDAKPKWYQLDRLTTKELAGALDCENGTLRDMVHQLLLWRNDRAAIPELKRLLEKSTWIQAKPHALYLLNFFGALDDKYLTEFIKDRRGTLLRHGLRICETRMNESKTVRHRVLSSLWANASSSPEFMAQQQLALTLGNLNDEASGLPLARLARYYPDDRYMTASILSSLNQKNVRSVMHELVAPEENRPWKNFEKAPSKEFLTGLITTIVGYEDRIALENVFKLRKSAAGQQMGLETMDVLAVVLNAAKQHKKELKQLLNPAAMPSIARTLQIARAVVADSAKPIDQRIAALTLFGMNEMYVDQELSLIAQACLPNQPIDLQKKAIQRLAVYASPDAVDQTLSQWQALTPSARAELLDIVFSRRAWITSLLKSINEKKILPIEINARRRQQLIAHDRADIRDLAKSLFATAESDRKAVVSKYLEVQRKGDAIAGKELFSKHCSACHEMGGIGNNVGPLLQALTNKSTESLLVAILDPNRAVEDKYLDFVVVTDDGRQIAGMLLQESNNSITLAGADGKTKTVLRSQVEQFKATGRSLMPTGMEQEIQPDQMPDLIAFIQKQHTPRNQFAGNVPQVAPVRDDGSIRLFGMHASIFGPTLMFEQKYRNLGYWQSDMDYATWQMNVPKAGTYAVTVDYSCPDAQAGDRFVLKANGQSVGGSVDATGSWDNYRRKKVGEIQLPKGSVAMSVQSDGPINGFLMDLRTVILYPE